MIVSEQNLDNPAALVLMVIFYNLLITDSANIFENKSKSLIVEVLQLRSSIYLTDSLDINAFMSIRTNQIAPSSNARSLPNRQQFASSDKTIKYNPSNQQAFRKQMSIFMGGQNEKIDSFETNQGNLQIYYSLIIELNRITQAFDPNFEKPLFIQNYENISVINAVKTHSAAVSLFNETASTISTAKMPVNGQDSQLFALIIRTNKLMNSSEILPSINTAATSNTDGNNEEKSSKKKQSSKQKSNMMEVESVGNLEEQQMTSQVENIVIGLEKALALQKSYEQQSNELLSYILGYLLKNEREQEQAILMQLLQQQATDQFQEVFDSFNSEDGIVVDALRFLLIGFKPTIDRELSVIHQHLKSNSSALYITELLLISSKPLSYFDQNLSSKITTAHFGILPSFNKFLFTKMMLKELAVIIYGLFKSINKSPAAFKQFYNYESGAPSKIQGSELCTQVLLSNIRYSDCLPRASLESVEQLFNGQIRYFSDYFKNYSESQSQPPLVEHEKLAFMHILHRFYKYSLTASLFDSIISYKVIDEISAKILTISITNLTNEIKLSPLNLKALCLAFSSISPRSANPHLLTLCQRILNVINHPISSSNCLLDVLLRFPNRHAELLLPLIGQKNNQNLKEKLWFPLFNLIKTGFSTSSIEHLYQLDSQEPQSDSQNNQSSNEVPLEEINRKQKAVENLINEMTLEDPENKEGQLMVTALKKMTGEQFVSLRSQITRCNYEISKSVYYNTESVANFRLLRSNFTKSTIIRFRQILSAEKSVIQSFIRDCQVSHSKIASIPLGKAQRENVKEFINICFEQLMEFFETLIRESRDLDQKFINQILLLSGEIIEGIIADSRDLMLDVSHEASSGQNETNKNKNEKIIAYSCERIITVVNFIFSNLNGLAEFQDLERLLRLLVTFVIGLSKNNCAVSKQYHIQILYLITLHAKQFDMINPTGSAKKRKRIDSIALPLLPETLTLSKEQSIITQSQMEVEPVSREKLVEDIDKKINAIPEEIVSANCTLEKTKGKSTFQVFFQCHTCNIAEQIYVLCQWCAFNCHNGHDLVCIKSLNGTCDCSSKGPKERLQTKEREIRKQIASEIRENSDFLDEDDKEEIEGEELLFDEDSERGDDIYALQPAELEIPLHNPPSLLSKPQKMEESDSQQQPNQNIPEQKQATIPEPNQETSQAIATQDYFPYTKRMYLRESHAASESNKKESVQKELENNNCIADLGVIEAKKGQKEQDQKKQQQQSQNEYQKLIQQIISEGYRDENTSAIQNLFHLCDESITALIPKWEMIAVPNRHMILENAEANINFLANVSLNGQSMIPSKLDTCVGKGISKIGNPGQFDLRIREDPYGESGYFQMPQGIFGGQPAIPMIIRNPIDSNGQNLIAVASGNRVFFLDKMKLLLKYGVAENLDESQSGNYGRPGRMYNPNNQNNVQELAASNMFRLEYTTTQVKFSPKNPNIIVICGLISATVCRLNNDNRIAQSVNFSFKSMGDYINKVAWLPYSDVRQTNSL